MKDYTSYQGKVTLNFYRKDGTLKGSYSNHNLGTPYFFWVITDTLNRRVNQNSDNRPGRLMLTRPDGTKCFGQSVPLVQSYSFPDEIRDSDGQVIDYATPLIRYEFNISYYDLLSTGGDISSLTGYRMWLLSYNALSSDDWSGIEGQITDNIENVLENITYSTVLSKSYPRVCAQVQISSDYNYSLEEGEYITVLWDMYFNNQNTSSSV